MRIRVMLTYICFRRYIISVNGQTNTLIKQFFSFNEMDFGTSIASRRKRIFGRTQDEVAALSGDIIRKSDLWFKEYNNEGDFVNEKLARLDKQAILTSASRTWMFPDQTRLIDDQGYVFSVSGAEHVYSLDIPAIIDIAWLSDEVMIALHRNGSLTALSQELVVTGTISLDTNPSNIAVARGKVFAFELFPINSESH